MTAAIERLLTAEEYSLLPDNGRPTELIRGRVVEMNMPAPRHGYFCNQIGRILGNFVEEHDLGRVMSNDSGVVTNRGPDTVRGADVCYYSYIRLPKGPLPEGYLPVVPELIFEVRSPTDRWSQIMAKVGDYFSAGVLIVCVLDPQAETLIVYHADEIQRLLTTDDELSLPDLLGPDFRVPVRRFLE
jgi:Uma2 family endonuclease